MEQQPMISSSTRPKSIMHQLISFLMVGLIHMYIVVHEQFYIWNRKYIRSTHEHKQNLLTILNGLHIALNYHAQLFSFSMFISLTRMHSISLSLD